MARPGTLKKHARKKPTARGKSSRRAAMKGMKGKKKRSAASRKRSSAGKGPGRSDRAFLEGHPAISRSTLRALWISSPAEHEERPGQTLATRNPRVIQAWAEARGAAPATVSGARPRSAHLEAWPGVLQFDFPGYGGRRGEKIDWKDWFETFEERELVFLYQEHQRDGKPSNFFRMDHPQREDA